MAFCIPLPFSQKNTHDIDRQIYFYLNFSTVEIKVKGSKELLLIYLPRMKPGGTAHQHYYLARVGLGHLTELVLKFLKTEMKITFQIPIET